MFFNLRVPTLIVRQICVLIVHPVLFGSNGCSMLFTEYESANEGFLPNVENSVVVQAGASRCVLRFECKP